MMNKTIGKAILGGIGGMAIGAVIAMLTSKEEPEVEVDVDVEIVDEPENEE